VHYASGFHLYIVSVPSFKAFYDSNQHVLFSMGDIKADVFDQLILLIHIHKVGSDVSIGLFWGMEAHPHRVHSLWDN